MRSALVVVLLAGCGGVPAATHVAAPVTHATPTPAPTTVSKKPEGPALAEADAAFDRAVEDMHAWRFDDAAKELETAVKIREARLGPDHDDTLNALVLLGRALRRGGHYEQSEQVLTRALAGRQHGDDFVATAIVLDELGQSLAEGGQLHEGIASLEQALALHDEHHTPAEDPDRLTVMENLGMTYGDAGDHVREAHYLELVLAHDKKVDPRGPNTGNTMHNLAMSYRDGDQVKRSIKLFLEALAIETENYGEAHTRLISTLTGLAGAYHLDNDEKHAEQYALRALGVAEANEVPPAGRVITLTILGDVAQAEHKWEQALGWWNRSLVILDAMAPTGNAETTRVLVKRSTTLAALHRDDESLRDEQRLIEVAARVYGANDPETRHKLEWLADDLTPFAAKDRVRALRERAKLIK